MSQEMKLRRCRRSRIDVRLKNEKKKEEEKKGKRREKKKKKKEVERKKQFSKHGR